MTKSKTDKLLIGQATTLPILLNGDEAATSINNMSSNKSNTLLELTANNNYSTGGHGKLNAKLAASDRNNNDDAENLENNKFYVLRNEETIDQSVQAAIRQKIKALAMKGNELAKQSDYVKAIEKFTEALEYDVTDQRFISLVSRKSDNL